MIITQQKDEIEDLSSIFKEKGYKVLSEQKIGAQQYDMILEKDDKKFVYEIEQGERINFYRALEQLKKKKPQNFNGMFLVVSDDVKIPRRIKRLYKKYGIGILSYDDEDKEVEMELNSEDKNFQDFLQTDIKDELIAEKSIAKSKNFRDDLIVNVIFAGILTSSMWLLIEAFLQISPLQYNQIIIITLILIFSFIGIILYTKLVIEKRDIIE
ncbi:MAG: hypothetical protein ACP6IY_11515 [Promethearchaeia archaeon]